MITVIKTAFSAIMTVLFVLSGSAFGNFRAPFEPKDKENCKLSFAVIADVHMKEGSVRRNMLELGLYDMEHAKAPLDALVVVGDITDNGNRPMYENVSAAFSKYTPAKNIILAVGNHDTWNDEVDEEHEYEQSKKLFIEYNKTVANREIDSFNYSTVVNGYTFIVMGADSSSTNTALSDEQLLWLEAELDRASESGMPIFVVSHWALRDTHGLPVLFNDPTFAGTHGVEEDDGSFSSNAYELYELLNRYEDIFFISGHLHSGFANGSKLMVYPYSSVETHGNIHCINVPCYMYANTKGIQIPGNGFQFEVYDDEVLIRGRSYTAGVWYTGYEYRMELGE